MSRQEVAIDAALLEKIFASLGPDAVLVGGQALAIWISHYKLDDQTELPPGVSVSDDADFLGRRTDVAAIAKALHTKALFPRHDAITALVGQVEISMSLTQYINVDVIDRVVGLDAEAIRRNASTLELGSATFRVMHPLDVLASRVENLKQLPEKRNADGALQARLAVLVARRYILELLQVGDEKKALKAIERVVEIAKSSAGRTATRDFQVDFGAGLPLELVKNASFRGERLPRLLEELRRGFPL